MSTLNDAGLAVSELLGVAFRLNELAAQANESFTQPSMLTSARWQVLRAVADAPATVAHVARSLGLTRQSVQLTTDALAREGFVSWSENPLHKTAWLITLTPAGRRALAAIEKRRGSWANALGKQLDVKQLRAAQRTLERVSALLKLER